MNRKFFAFCCSVLIFAGCKEHDIPLFSGNNTVVTPSTDSTYLLATVPAADQHNVLVEEFTGQSCSNCPTAHAALDAIADSGNVIVIGLYINHFSQTTPPSGATYDFRDSTATDISTAIYGSVGSIPSAGIDRVPSGGTILLFRPVWSADINSRKTVTDSVNLAVESSFSGGVATIKATITYLKPMSTRQNLSIAIVEDSMVDIQEDQSPSGYDNTYLFTNVFRGMVTSGYIGDPVLDTMATKAPGRVYWRKYKYTPKVKTPAIVPAHCRVIAFVNSPGAGGDYHVLQTVQARLVP